MPSPPKSPALVGVAPTPLPASTPTVTPVPGVAPPPEMDREFIIRNQIVERYLGGRLPPRGAQDFERFCREHPQLLDEINLSDRLSAALRLLETGGQAPPWESRPRKPWERLPVLLGVAGLAVVLAVTSLLLAGRLAARDRSLAILQQRADSQPLDPAKSTRTITVIPSRTAPSRQSLVAIGGHDAQLADLKIDVSWSPFTAYRISIDRIGQGRVAVLHNVLRDSNGNLHLGLNSSALGPGDYELTIEGLNWSGEASPQAWATISIVH